MSWQSQSPGRTCDYVCVAVWECAEKDASWSKHYQSRFACKPHYTLQGTFYQRRDYLLHTSSLNFGKLLICVFYLEKVVGM